MHPDLDSILNEAENRYLKPEELGLLTRYVTSLPARLETYRALRDSEITLMQSVADQLVAQMPGEAVENLERSIKNALLVLRHCAMGMLLNDETLVKSRLQGWLSQTIQVFNSQAIDSTLYRLLEETLACALSPQQMELLRPMLKVAQATLLPPEAPLTAAALNW